MRDLAGEELSEEEAAVWGWSQGYRPRGIRYLALRQGNSAGKWPLQESRCCVLSGLTVAHIYVQIHFAGREVG